MTPLIDWCDVLYRYWRSGMRWSVMRGPLMQAYAYRDATLDMLSRSSFFLARYHDGMMVDLRRRNVRRLRLLLQWINKHLERRLAREINNAECV